MGLKGCVLVVSQFVSLGMHFQDILGQETLKKTLQESLALGRIPHAQLFEGQDGQGILGLALAYANAVVCGSNKLDTPSRLKANNLIHPDIHFIFPTTTSTDVVSKPTSEEYIPQWRQFVKEHPFGSLYDWNSFLGTENKQGVINVNDALHVIQKVNLKSFEGGWKCVLVWHAEKLNLAASNKLLKSIEEPPEKTLFLLLCPDENQLLSTIRSRCQVLRLGRVSESVLVDFLIEKGSPLDQAHVIAKQAKGNVGMALALLDKQDEQAVYERWFVDWVRTAFRAKGNKAVVLDLSSWSQELASKGVETQKQFLAYAISVFRYALMEHYSLASLSLFHSYTGFELKKFAPFVSGANIIPIIQSLEKSVYHLERNGNTQMIFTDLSFKLTKLLHQKAA